MDEKDVTKLSNLDGNKARNCRDLLKGSKEFQGKKAHFSGGLLPEDPRCDGRSFTGNQTGRRRGRGGNGQMDCLIGPKNVC